VAATGSAQLRRSVLDEWRFADMGSIAKVLIVEWDTAEAEILWNEMRLAGHEPTAAFSIERANLMIEQDRPDAILLRWKLPDASGLSLLSELRLHAATSRLPVIVLGEQGAGEEECIRALEAGADDYVRRPFGIREVVARVQVVLRPVPRALVRRHASVDALTMDFDARRVLADTGPAGEQTELRMAPTCYRLLRLFVENPYEVLSRQEIIRHVWFGAAVKDGIVDVYVKALRGALEPLRERLVIETVRGEGFRLAAAAPAAVPPVVAEVPQPAVSLPASQPPSHPPRRSARRPAAERLRVNGAYRQPTLVSDLGAAVEKIRHLQALLQRKTEENRVLRNAMESDKPPLRSTPIRQKNKR
jgi:two-component system phosphate regulon response regulator PhoB